ncbi:MAG TPA: amidohydrolase family protein, partial [Burkholderiales bacterium]|nr:amidohydrolase family protein [Burkholderiales bacterium]
MSREGRPDFKSPPGGCDAHFHVFGPAGRYPYNQSDLRYAPPVAPVEDFLTLSKTLGLERFVFVQPSAYGRDNRCMLDAMRMIGTKNCRAIVDIDENAPDAELERLDALGVRGVRINVPPVKPFEAGFAAKLLPRIGRLAGRCAEIGWQLDFLTPSWLTSELMPTLGKLSLDFTIAHFGMFPAKDGVEQLGFQALLGLLRSGGRHCWVKLTGVYRMSVAQGFADAAPM